MTNVAVEALTSLNFNFDLFLGDHGFNDSGKPRKTMQTAANSTMEFPRLSITIARKLTREALPVTIR